MGDKIMYISHEHGDPVTAIATDKYTLKEFPKSRMDKFAQASTTRTSYEEMMEAFDRNGLVRLKAFALALLHTFLSYDEGEGVHPSALAQGSSFLMNIMRVAGYGRALKHSAAAKSAPAREGNYNYMAQEMEQIILRLHDAAISRGFTATTKSTFVPRCISY